MNANQKELAIGIDLGTTYSCVAVFEDGQCQIIPDINSGKRTFPSYVAFTENGRLIGHQAKEQAELNSRNTIYDVKRLIGRQFREVETDIKQWPFDVEEKEKRIRISVNYRGAEELFAPEEISAMVLRQLKSLAERYLERTITKAVITVPAYFNDAQRQATKDAGTIAGLTVLRIINEPTAAALAYGLNNRSLNYERNVLVFDLGGGTLDVSILTIINGIFEVKATSGNTHLGGEDFDHLLVKYVLAMYRDKFEVDVESTQKCEGGNGESDAEDDDSDESDRESTAIEEEGIEGNEIVLSILKAKCEQAKRELSDPSTYATKIEINAENVSFSLTITRDKFEELCADLFAKVLLPVETALKDAKVNAPDIDDIVLVGGSTRIPKIEENLLKYFGAGKTLNKSINPDEAVAYGAAVQAAILMGHEEETLKDYILLDVVPMSLGIEGARQKMDIFIPRNTLIPAIETKFFNPQISNQAAVKIRVFEGEHALVRENNLLGTFRLNLSQVSSKTKPLIELTFTVDANGILTVTATDTTDGGKSQITIDSDSGRLSREEITEMMQVVHENEQFDGEQRERLKAKESLQTTLYQVETLVREIEGNAILPLGEERMWIQTFNQTIEWLTEHPNATKEECQSRKKTLESLTKPISHIWFEKTQQLEGKGTFIASIQ